MSTRGDVAPPGTTDNRRMASSTVWDRLDAERRGLGAPFDANHSTLPAENTQLTGAQQTAIWAADLAAVQIVKPAAKTGVSDGSPYAWEATPGGPISAALPVVAADVQKQWAEQLREAQPVSNHHRKSGDPTVHGRPSAPAAAAPWAIASPGATKKQSATRTNLQHHEELVKEQWRKDLEQARQGACHGRARAAALPARSRTKSQVVTSLCSGERSTSPQAIQAAVAKTLPAASSVPN
jgi:hypothetical protein